MWMTWLKHAKTVQKWLEAAKESLHWPSQAYSIFSCHARLSLRLKKTLYNGHPDLSMAIMMRMIDITGSEWVVSFVFITVSLAFHVPHLPPKSY